MVIVINGLLLEDDVLDVAYEADMHEFVLLLFFLSHWVPEWFYDYTKDDGQEHILDDDEGEQIEQPLYIVSHLTQEGFAIELLFIKKIAQSFWLSKSIIQNIEEALDKSITRVYQMEMVILLVWLIHFIGPIPLRLNK